MSCLRDYYNNSSTMINEIDSFEADQQINCFTTSCDDKYEKQQQMDVCEPNHLSRNSDPSERIERQRKPLICGAAFDMQLDDRTLSTPTFDMQLYKRSLDFRLDLTCYLQSKYTSLNMPVEEQSYDPAFDQQSKDLASEQQMFFHPLAQKITNFKLSMKKEPMKYFEFSYKSDIIKSSSIGSKKITAAITFTGNSKADLYSSCIAICQLYQKFANDDVKLSPHLLKSTWQDYGEPQYRVIDEKNTIHFEPMYIVRALTKKEETNILRSKFEEYQKWTQNVKKLSTRELEDVKDKVTLQYGTKNETHKVVTLLLGFEVYQEIAGARQRIAGPIFSTPFTNGLVIAEQQAYSFNIGQEVNLKVYGVKNQDIIVRIYKTNMDNKLEWEQMVNNDIIHKRQGISFNMPMIKEIENLGEGIECQLEICAMSSNDRSEPLTICVKRKSNLVADAARPTLSKIINQTANKSPEQQPASEQPRESYTKVTLMALERLLNRYGGEQQEIFSEIVRLDVEYQARHTKGSTIFHAVVKNNFGILIKLHQRCESLKLRNVIRIASNKRKENLLHYACILNKPECIKPLLLMTCALDAEDIAGNTPLHIAIRKNRYQIIAKLLKILENIEDYSTLRYDINNLVKRHWNSLVKLINIQFNNPVLEPKNIKVFRDLLLWLKSNHVLGKNSPPCTPQ